jgi:hypothetical protein
VEMIDERTRQRPRNAQTLAADNPGLAVQWHPSKNVSLPARCGSVLEKLRVVAVPTCGHECPALIQLVTECDGYFYYRSARPTARDRAKPHPSKTPAGPSPAYAKDSAASARARPWCRSMRLLHRLPIAWAT